MRRRDRPFCFINLAMSLDGKISTIRRDGFPFSSRRDRRLVDRLRAESDAVLLGGGTIRAEDPPVRVRDPALVRSRVRRGLPPQPLCLVVSRGLQLPSGARFFQEAPGRRIVVTVRRSPVARRRRLEKVAEVWFAGERNFQPDRLLRMLRENGVRKLLIEGGGRINFPFLARDLVDEIYITLCPVIIAGAGAPTPVDGTGFLADAVRSARLVSARRMGQELFLRYRLGDRRIR